LKITLRKTDKKVYYYDYSLLIVCGHKRRCSSWWQKLQAGPGIDRKIVTDNFKFLHWLGSY